MHDERNWMKRTYYLEGSDAQTGEAIAYQVYVSLGKSCYVDVVEFRHETEEE